MLQISAVKKVQAITHANRQCIFPFGDIVYDIGLYHFNRQTLCFRCGFNFTGIGFQVIHCGYMNPFAGQGQGMTAIATHEVQHPLTGFQFKIREHKIHFPFGKDTGDHAAPDFLVLAFKKMIVDIAHNKAGLLFQQFVTHAVHHESRNGLGPHFLFHILPDGFNGTGTQEHFL